MLQSYNAENRLATVSRMNGDCETGTVVESWSFIYDGDGTRVGELHWNGTSTTAKYYFAGGLYEVSDADYDGSADATVKYYSIAGQSVAMDDGSGLQFLLRDHLGSVVGMTSNTGTLISEQRYLPFGAVRTDVGTILETDFGYTGQRNLSAIGWMDYRARFYSPALGKFTQPDTIVPNLGNPQSWNRYAYVQGNPIRYNDPSGHKLENLEGACVDSNSEYVCGGYYPEWHEKAGESIPDPRDRKIIDEVRGAITDVGDELIDEWNHPYGGGGFRDIYCGGVANTVDLLNCGAMFTQDAATAIDLAGVGMEGALFTAGCFVGGPAGCAEGLFFAQKVWLASGNPLESGFSAASFIFTLAADVLDDGEFGEASEMSLIGALVGGSTIDPMGDLIVDGYGSGYNHGIFNDIRTIFNGGSILK